MLTTLVALLSMALGAMYVAYGTLTAMEMVRSRRTMGISRFGLAWIAMTFTCGPHHFVHGVHLGFEGREAAFLDLVVLAAGLPAGLVWFGLRLEAFMGGPGDRYIKGTPAWVALLPPLGGVYVTALAAAMLRADGPFALNVEVAANVVLVVFYAAVSLYVARTQLENHSALGGWSLSGLAMSVAFPACAAMHAVYAWSMATGTYGMDPHNLLIDLLAVPAAIYFLWVVRALQRGTYRDWNGAPGHRASDREAGTAALGTA